MVPGAWLPVACAGSAQHGWAPGRPASHKWVREGAAAAAGPGPVAAPGSLARQASGAAAAPDTDAAEGADAGAEAQQPAAQQAPDPAVAAEALKAAEDKIALMRRLIELEEAKLKVAQQIKKRKAGPGPAGGAWGGRHGSKRHAPATSSCSPCTPGTRAQFRAYRQSHSLFARVLLPTGAKKQVTEAQGTTTAAGGASRPAPAATDDRAAKRHRPPAKGGQGANGSSGNGVGGHGQAAHQQQQQQQQETYAFEDDGTALYDEGYGEPEGGAGQQGAGEGLASVLQGLAAGAPEGQAADAGGWGGGKSASTPGSAGKRPR